MSQYRTIRVKEEVYKKFKRAKQLLEFQNGEEYSISQFQNFLAELQLNEIAPLVKDFYKKEKKKK